MDKKKRTAIVSVVAVLIVAIGAYWYVNYQIPHNAAVEAFTPLPTDFKAAMMT